MNEAYVKQKIILVVDSFLFLLCVIGIYQISEKAKLPFEINTRGNALFIKSEPNISYQFLNNSELVAIDNITVSSSEAIELITDTKNIGDTVLLAVRLDTSIEKIKVTLTNFYSNWYLLSISITSLLFFLTAVFIIVRKPNDVAANIFHWASVRNCLHD